ncbi:EAL domain-containing protein [Pseudomonas indica]|uniref:EAL domain-containing protein n=1 Tax=Pseudomonas indica TaxID=137658 RepID=UPI000BAB4CD5|nr:EAL domain-containing protein [Pseudomonas indica]PAU56432.1 cyclic diguanylate phosphodiesterase [Pseudomonas indica]
MSHPIARLRRAFYHPWPMALLAVLLSAAVLLLGSLTLAAQQARMVESEQMNARGERFLQRLEQVFGQLRQGLDQLEAQPLRGCDIAMVETLRQVAFKHRFIYEAAFVGGRQRCSSWPRQSSLGAERPADIQDETYRYWLNTASQVNDDLAALVVGRGYFRVSVSRGHFADVVDLPEGGSLLFVPKAGGAPLPILGPEHYWPPAEGWPPKDDDALVLTEGQLIYRMPSRIPQYDLVLAVPRDDLMQKVRDGWRMLVPGSLILALLIGALVLQLVRHRQSLSGELEGALHRRELRVRYQPIFDLASRRCVGAEALVRWMRPDGTLATPDLFVPLAEATGQIRDITDYVLEQVLEDLGDLLQQNPHLYISVNLAACDVTEPRIGQVAASLLAQYRVPASQIAFEISERGLTDIEAARGQLMALRANGHRVLIDDFGTGYCSLAHLQNLPVDYLKIDKSFVDALGHDAASSGVAPHIIRMAHALKLKVIAEGIEQEAQARLLGSEGAHYGQGWLFAQPLTADKLRTLVEQDIPVIRAA